MKYKEEIQVITTVNEFLIFHTNLFNQHDANYYEIRSHMRRFIIRIYAGAPKNSFQFCLEFSISSLRLDDRFIHVQFSKLV